jgi:hypothetical protein
MKILKIICLWLGLLFTIYGLFVVITSDEPNCGYDGFYDNNCEITN